MRDEGESCWGWIHVVSILIAVALHGIALYAVASLFNKPVPQQKPLTVVVRMQKASPASDAAGPPSGVQQAATPPSRKAKSLHKTTLPPSGHEITSSPASSMASTPLSVMPNASGTQASESLSFSPGIAPGVAVGSDLAFFCPVRPALVYPRISRNMGEEGIVILHVEWDQKGQITSSRVQGSSGFRRLDDAVLTAINGWRCMAKQGGVPVRAVAVQPFRFQLQEE